MQVKWRTESQSILFWEKTTIVFRECRRRWKSRIQESWTLSNHRASKRWRLWGAFCPWLPWTLLQSARATCGCGGLAHVTRHASDSSVILKSHWRGPSTPSLVVRKCPQQWQSLTGSKKVSPPFWIGQQWAGLRHCLTCWAKRSLAWKALGLLLLPNSTCKQKLQKVCWSLATTSLWASPQMGYRRKGILMEIHA
jgi:hypothetical protein